MTYIKRIRDTREDNDKYQKEVAAILDMTPQQYSLYEKGQRKLPIDKLKIFCEYFNVSADYILGLIDEPRPIK